MRPIKTAKALVFQPRYKQQVVRAKKGKGAYTRKGRDNGDKIPR